MNQPTTDSLRQHVIDLLDMKGAHAGFRKAVRDFPEAARGTRVGGAPHTPWQLLEHMRLAQWDILDFSRNPQYQELDFPAGYWPPTEAPPDAQAWDRSMESFLADLEAMKQLVADPGSDLLAVIPWGTGQTLLREALLVADHNSYHLGQLIQLRRIAGAWESRFDINS